MSRFPGRVMSHTWGKVQNPDGQQNVVQLHATFHGVLSFLRRGFLRPAQPPAAPPAQQDGGGGHYPWRWPFAREDRYPNPARPRQGAASPGGQPQGRRRRLVTRHSSRSTPGPPGRAPEQHENPAHQPFPPSPEDTPPPRCPAGRRGPARGRGRESYDDQQAQGAYHWKRGTGRAAFPGTSIWRGSQRAGDRPRQHHGESPAIPPSRAGRRVQTSRAGGRKRRVALPLRQTGPGAKRQTRAGMARIASQHTSATITPPRLPSSAGPRRPDCPPGRRQRRRGTCRRRPRWTPALPAGRSKAGTRTHHGIEGAEALPLPQGQGGTEGADGQQEVGVEQAGEHRTSPASHSRSTKGRSRHSRAAKGT